MPKSKKSKRANRAVPLSRTSTPDEAKAKPKQAKLKRKTGLTLNWKRAIHISSVIDDALLKELTPIILQMKQESSDPITVGIDSHGGSVAAMDSLLGLLQSPDQDGRCTSIYTAATNRAYSAAASLLAFGDYAVAFPHSRILYHDLRYSGIEDVTPSKALQTARELERGNVAFSLKLANQIRGRLIWVYIDMKREFDDVRTRYESFAKRYDDAFAESHPQRQKTMVDVVGFSLALYQRLSPPADEEIAIRALDLLKSWMEIETIESRLSSRHPEDERLPDLVKGINALVSEIRSMGSASRAAPNNPEPEQQDGLDENAQSDIKLLLEVLARRFARDKGLSIGGKGLDLIMEDFSFIKDINSNEQVRAITKMMIDYDQLFFGRPIADEIKGAKDHSERAKIMEPVYPQARMLWYYIVLICRCLCEGDHLLTPGDAQLLGLVDEVLGGGPVESKREWRKANPG